MMRFEKSKKLKIEPDRSSTVSLWFKEIMSFAITVHYPANCNVFFS